MWNILQFEEADDNCSDIGKENLMDLIDMLFEEVETRSISAPHQQLKAFASLDVLDILQTVYQDCFKSTLRFELTIGEISKGTIFSKRFG